MGQNVACIEGEGILEGIRATAHDVSLGLAADIFDHPQMFLSLPACSPAHSVSPYVVLRAMRALTGATSVEAFPRVFTRVRKPTVLVTQAPGAAVVLSHT